MKTKMRLLLAGLLLVVGTQAHALLLTPGDADLSGNENGNLDATFVEGQTGDSPLALLYKDNVGGSEEGSFQSSYDTTFSNTETDPSDALIEYISGDAIAANDPLWLLVKDGSQEPAWYLFDLFAAGWDGMEDIVLEGFWPNQGAISHVSIFGGQTQVPEPATLVLLGLGLLAMGGLMSRRKVAA